MSVTPASPTPLPDEQSGLEPRLHIVRDAGDELIEEELIAKARKAFPLIGLEGLANLQRPIDLWEGFVPQRGTTFIVGPPGTGKTLLGVDISLSMATRRESFFGRPLRPGSVVYALAEGYPSLQRRTAAWAWAHPDAGAAPGCIEFTPRVPILCDAQSVQDFVLAIASRNLPLPALVTIDTYSRAMAGWNENSTEDTTKAVAALDFIRTELDTTVLCLHHPGKDLTKGARGNTALIAAIDAELTLKCVDGIRELKVTKMRDGPLDQKLSFCLVPAMGSAHLALTDNGSLTRPLIGSQKTALRTLQSLQTPVSAKSWLTASGLTHRTFYRTVEDLVHRGLVTKSDSGYEVPSAK